MRNGERERRGRGRLSSLRATDSMSTRHHQQYTSTSNGSNERGILWQQELWHIRTPASFYPNPFSSHHTLLFTLLFYTSFASTSILLSHLFCKKKKITEKKEIIKRQPASTLSNSGRFFSFWLFNERDPSRGSHEENRSLVIQQRGFEVVFK